MEMETRMLLGIIYYNRLFYNAETHKQIYNSLSINSPLIYIQVILIFATVVLQVYILLTLSCRV